MKTCEEIAAAIRDRYRLLSPILDERRRRLWAGAEAIALGHGGIKAVCEATGLSPSTLRAGIAELEGMGEGTQLPAPQQQRIRRPGGGRKKLTQTDPTLLSDLNRLIDPATRGDPESPLLWTSKSTYKLSEELACQGHRVSPRAVAYLLRDQDYSLQGNRKTKEGSSHPDRDEQFKYINQQTLQMQERGQPVISVDAKKKELVGSYKNGGEEWQPKGSPEEVNVHDFPDKELGKAVPYGVYDITLNEGWVSVGINHDTAQFAVQSIWNWWQQMGKESYPEATELMITCDGGGSNGYRTRLWKAELQELADELGMAITVSHFPPGTSKWNKIEHRMFCHITQNWRGRPLVSYEVIVNLIGSATTSQGLKIRAALDPEHYEKGIAVTDEQMKSLRIQPADFHGEWNYTIRPRIT